MRDVPSIEELRRICQDPVRHRNDFAGALYGWRISIHLTRLFLRFGLGPNAASVAMLVSGLLGSLAMLVPHDAARALGAFLVAFAFVLDCVDGELARFHGLDSFRWAAFDHVHHLLVKSLAFFCAGVGLWLQWDLPLAAAAGGLGSICWLALMHVRDLGAVLFARKVVLDDRRAGNPAYRRMEERLRRLTSEPARLAPDRSPFADGVVLAPWVVRNALTSFDVAALLLFLCAAADLFVPPFELFGRSVPLAAALLAAYAVLLPFHAADLLLHAMRRGGLRDELYDLARRVERFRDVRGGPADARDRGGAPPQPTEETASSRPPQPRR